MEIDTTYFRTLENGGTASQKEVNVKYRSKSGWKRHNKEVGYRVSSS